MPQAGLAVSLFDLLAWFKGVYTLAIDSTNKF